MARFLTVVSILALVLSSISLFLNYHIWYGFMSGSKDTPVVSPDNTTAKKTRVLI